MRSARKLRRREGAGYLTLPDGRRLKVPAHLDSWVADACGLLRVGQQERLELIATRDRLGELQGHWWTRLGARLGRLERRLLNGAAVERGDPQAQSRGLSTTPAAAAPGFPADRDSHG